MLRQSLRRQARKRAAASPGTWRGSTRNRYVRAYGRATLIPERVGRRGLLLLGVWLLPGAGAGSASLALLRCTQDRPDPVSYDGSLSEGRRLCTHQTWKARRKLEKELGAASDRLRPANRALPQFRLGCPGGSFDGICSSLCTMSVVRLLVMKWIH